ncbi:putative N-acetyltransferase YhbS [Dongia mobilis]|uniref:Putative N-acetyltransferase YhbS n=1 Tax=Dongia mobilis TaxID=578943 RepID=A0A4R6WMW0_9PROT|nr:N-acetyltransferase [Dongia mobilis]TDQ82342.1 putative N-acetyltransferase YhbS [Dongia mobilis]
MNQSNTSQFAFTIKPESAALAAGVEQLLDAVFGRARFDKASYLYRVGVEPVAELSWIAEHRGEIVGTIRYWPIHIGPEAHPALLLGPLGIAPRLAGKGIGRTLTFRTLEIAAELGHDLVLLVGDVDYYKRFGFVPAAPHGFVMPGEARPERLQVAPLKRGLLGQVQGEIRHVHGLEPAAIASGIQSPLTAIFASQAAMPGQQPLDQH